PWAIYVYSSCNNYIANNNVSSNGNGIYLYTSSCNNSITNNNASNNTNVGIYLKSSSSNNYIANNNVSSNSYYGFYLSSSCNNNNITNNNASRNSKYGFYLSSSNNNILTYNWICNNANYGVYITSSSTGNYIHHNNFIANNGASKGVNGECQAYDNVGSNLWYDSATNKGNYWSNWDNSGSYPIDGGAGASDGNPLSEPVREFSAMPLFAVIFGGIIGITWFRRRKN
ncbi:MAG: right-handed parallel beta-helix repeat-containing protein, partial [Thermoplasmata archaeon]|nr:right-handed parallel beta-helix repeat-containing protein [Thermoplasmata archaeon]